jgi:hypothetical protein
MRTKGKKCVEEQGSRKPDDRCSEAGGSGASGGGCGVGGGSPSTRFTLVEGDISRSRVKSAVEEAQTLRVDGTAAADVDCGESGMGTRISPRDAAACGRAIRMLSVVDAYTRECLAWKWIRVLPTGE